MLKHQSTVSEDGKPRQVSLEIKAVGIGAVTQSLARWVLGQEATAEGFITAARNGKGLSFHITEVHVEPVDLPNPAEH